MISFSFSESWLTLLASFWILTGRKLKELNGVSSIKVDSYTTTNKIHGSIHWLNQLLQDVQETGWERDQRN